MSLIKCLLYYWGALLSDPHVRSFTQKGPVSRNHYKLLMTPMGLQTTFETVAKTSNPSLKQLGAQTSGPHEMESEGFQTFRLHASTDLDIQHCSFLEGFWFFALVGHFNMDPRQEDL